MDSGLIAVYTVRKMKYLILALCLITLHCKLQLTPKKLLPQWVLITVYFFVQIGIQVTEALTEQEVGSNHLNFS